MYDETAILIKMSLLAKLKNASYELLQPRCMLCQLPTAHLSEVLCALCQQELPLIKSSACLKCGSLQNSHTCETAWQSMTAALSYELEAKYLMLQFKFANKSHLGEFFAQLIYTYIQQKIDRGVITVPQAIVSIPLHPKKLRKRGYNQAEIIAKTLAKQLRIPYLPLALTRTKDTLAQSQQSKSRRKHNMENAFCSHQLFTVSHVALVDDVVTTGETISQATKVLQQAGIKTVDIFTVARTYR